MKRLVNFSIIVLFSLVFTLAIATPTHARTVTEQERADMVDIIFYDDGTMYPIDGLEDADPTSFEFGDTVPIYQHLSDGSINQSMEFIPLMYDGRYVAGFYKICEGTYTFLTGMADVLQEYRDKTGADEVAVVFDANGMNITDGHEMSLYGPPEDKERAESVLTHDPLKASELSELDLGNASERVPAYSNDSQRSLQQMNSGGSRDSINQATVKRLTVQPVMQPYGTYICRAACMSMVYGFSTGTYYIASDVAVYYHFLCDPDPFNTSFDVTRTGYWIADKLNNWCNLGNYQFHQQLPLSSSNFEGITQSMITAYVDAGYPIIGWLNQYYDDTTSVPGTYSHVAVFDGYVSDGRACVHDPWPTTGDVLANPYHNTHYNHWIYCYYLPDSSSGTPVYMCCLSHIKYDV